MSSSPKLISIIIPVYNVEAYLNKCVDSVLKQTYANLEVILVDDGSTDGSGKLCDEIKGRDERVRVFHKKNGGLSDARNYGIARAGGEYIGFVDSDDWVDKNMYSSLMDGCLKFDADIAWCNKTRVYNKKNVKEISVEKNGVVSKEDALLLLLRYDPSAGNKIYRKKLFDDRRFPKGKLYEDISTIPYLIDRSNRVYLDSIYGYYYNQQNENSITHKKFSLDKMDYYYGAKKLNDFITNKYPSLQMASERFFVLSITTILTDMYDYRNEYRKEYELLIKELRKINYKDNKYIPKFKKVMIFLDLHHMIWAVNIIKKIRNSRRGR